MGKACTTTACQLIDKQLKVWDTAKNNYEALSSVKVKEFKIGKSTIKVQFNPARITSSAAKIDTKTISERKCFLCENNRPAVQEGLPWDLNYTILVNPFPIFPKHLTIPDNGHVDQRIYNRIGDMMALAKDLDGFTLFYNGPKCGASAPDHMHFQAGNRGFMGYEDDWNKANIKFIDTIGTSNLLRLDGLAQISFMIVSASIADGTALFHKLYHALEINEGEPEPMLNLLTWHKDGEWFVAVFPRKKHRPSCYTAEGDDNMLISPASVDMGGVFITPIEKDFNKITATDIENILNEICISSDDADKIVERVANDK